MPSSPRLTLPALSWSARPPRRPTTRRSLASISAGPGLGSRISSSPQSALTATRPPSLTTAKTGTDRPAVLNRRQRPRADDRSLRASTSTASAVPASSNEDGSGGAVRTVCGSSDNDGSTGSGCSSDVSSSSSNKPLQPCERHLPNLPTPHGVSYQDT